MDGWKDRSEMQKLNHVASGEGNSLVVMTGLALVGVLLPPQVVMVVLVVSPYLLPYYFPHPISNTHPLSFPLCFNFVMCVRMGR